MTVTVEEVENHTRNSKEKKEEEEEEKREENGRKDGKEKKNNERRREGKSQEKKIIRVFSLNVWGIPLGISKDKSERMQAIIQSLIRDPYDYVFLQEVWDKRDFKKLQQWLTTSVLPYSHYFGSGTCIFSRTPIKEAKFYPYSLCGYPHKIFHGDWFAGKGLGLCKTEFEGIPILLVNSHFHAAYTGEDYEAHRVFQAFEASQMLKETTIDHHLAIFGTDFNSGPCDIPFKIFIYNSGFRDSFTTCEKEPPIGTEITSGNPRNSYTVSDSEKRIDYILYRHTEDYKVKVLLHDHPLPAKVPFKDFSYSDHEALRTIISIERRSSINSDESVVNDNTRNCNMFAGEEKTFLEAYKICDEGLQNAFRYQLLWFSITLGLIVFMPMLMWYFIYNDESRCKNRSTELGRFTGKIVEESSECLLCWIISILSTFCVVLLFFSLYMSFISARRECNSLRKAKNFIFQKVFEVACKHSNQLD